MSWFHEISKSNCKNGFFFGKTRENNVVKVHQCSELISRKNYRIEGALLDNMSGNFQFHVKSVESAEILSHSFLVKIS